jgi:ubiquitin-protein ligase
MEQYQRRIESKINNQIKQLSKVYNVKQDEKDRFVFYVEVHIDTDVYKDQTHVIKINLLNPSTGKYYPMSPPHMSFMSTIFHPNISLNGSICMDMFYNESKNWIPTISLETMVNTIILLLCEPNFDGSHMNAEASRLWASYAKKKISLDDVRKQVDSKYQKYKL